MSITDAARALRRLQAQGGSLGNRDRRALRAAADALAGSQPEVVKPLADRAVSLLTALLHAEPELEKVVLHPTQFAWLVAFLSEREEAAAPPAPPPEVDHDRRRADPAPDRR